MSVTTRLGTFGDTEILNPNKTKIPVNVAGKFFYVKR